VQTEDGQEDEYEGTSPRNKVPSEEERIDRIGLAPQSNQDGWHEMIDPKSGAIVQTKISRGPNGETFRDVATVDPVTQQPRVSRRVVGKDGTMYNYKKKTNPKNGKAYRTRRTRYHSSLGGDEREYEYQYDLEDPEAKPQRKRVPQRKQNIGEIGGEAANFADSIESKTGKTRKVRRVTAPDGVQYEDVLEEDPKTGLPKIKRRALDEAGEALRYTDSTRGKRIRHSRSLNVAKACEQEYEYEYENDDSGYRRTALPHATDDKIYPIAEDSTRGSDATITRVHRFTGDDNQPYEDVITKNPETGDQLVVRHRMTKNRDGYAYKRKRNTKTSQIYRTRRTRHRNPTGDEYEYEYQYDDQEGLTYRHRVAPGKEQLSEIGGEIKANPAELFDIDERTFTDKIDPETGRKVLVRISTGENGGRYQDVLFDDPTTNQPKLVRRALAKTGDDLAYTEKANASGERRTVRHSRYRTFRGEEYEYEYQYDDEGEETISERKLVKDQVEETIEMISRLPRRQRALTESSAVSVAPRLRMSASMPIAIFDSGAEVDGRTSPAAATQPSQQPQTVDLSERELLATGRENPLAQLTPKLRSEAERGNGENLSDVLANLQREIEERTHVRDDLKQKIQELMKPQQKAKLKLEISGVRTVPISGTPDATHVLALVDYNRRSAWSQTDTTNAMIEEKLRLLERQRSEKRAAESLHESLQSLEVRIADTKAQIEAAKREGEEKKLRIRQLKTEMGQVQGDIQQEDLLALKEEARAREYAVELDRVDGQIKAKEMQLEKVTNQVGALQMHLKEMQKFRLILETELTDLQKRERPEVRQLMEDLQESRAKLTEASGKVAQMTAEVEQKRMQLEQLQRSDEVKRCLDLKMERINLDRRLKKWTALLKESKESWKELETFSGANAPKRRAAAEGLKVKERMIIQKEAEVADLEQYAELLETMIREHKQIWA
jgi:hypothetical protein